MRVAGVAKVPGTVEDVKNTMSAHRALLVVLKEVREMGTD